MSMSRAQRGGLADWWFTVDRVALFAMLALGRGDGRYAKLMRQLGRVDLLILDLCAAHSDVERYRPLRY